MVRKSLQMNLKKFESRWDDWGAWHEKEESERVLADLRGDFIWSVIKDDDWGTPHNRNRKWAWVLHTLCQDLSWVSITLLPTYTYIQRDKPKYTLLFKSLGSVCLFMFVLKKDVFSKDTLKTLTLLRKMYSNKCCSFELLSIHQRILKRKMYHGFLKQFLTLMIIINVSVSPISI